MPSSVLSDEILDRLAPVERGWIEAFRDAAREGLGSRLRDLRIFGSKVRGDFGEESDIDLLVLVDRLDYATWQTIVALAHSISSWLSPVVEDFDGYHSPASMASGFYREMRKESVRL